MNEPQSISPIKQGQETDEVALDPSQRKTLPKPVLTKASIKTETNGKGGVSKNHPQAISPARSVRISKPVEAAQGGGWLSWLLSKTRRSSANVREELEDAIAAETINSQGFSAEEKTLINNVLRLHDVRIEDVMVARAEMEAVDITTSLGDLLVQFEESGHSRMPAYADSLDDPRGMVHIRDVVGHITRNSLSAKRKKPAVRNGTGAGPNIKNINFDKTIGELKLVREVLFVPPSMLASDLMEKMQANRIQMALVIDEYGGTDGLVSLEDLVEIIVGDIEDEHDESDEDLIKDLGDNVYLCDARAELDDLREILGKKFQPGNLAEDVETIGGLIFEITGRIPVRGEVIEALGFEFRVVEADPRRICSVEITSALSKNA